MRSRSISNDAIFGRTNEINFQDEIDQIMVDCKINPERNYLLNGSIIFFFRVGELSLKNNLFSGCYAEVTCQKSILFAKIVFFFK